MKNSIAPLATLLAFSVLSGCATHEPLSTIDYRAPATMASDASAATLPPVPTTAVFEAGKATGHALWSASELPGGYDMDRLEGTDATLFNAGDQAALLDNLMRVLAAQGVVTPVAAGAKSAATLTVKFLRTEYFPEQQNYVLDVLVTARSGSRTFQRVYHTGTGGNVNRTARTFHHPIDGRRAAAEEMLSAIVPDLGRWFGSAEAETAARDHALVVPQHFERCAPELAAFLSEHYAHSSGSPQDVVDVYAGRAAKGIAVVELRWSNPEALPAFCLIDIYAEGAATRITMHERNPPPAARVHVAEALQEYVQSVQSAPSSQERLKS